MATADYPKNGLILRNEHQITDCTCLHSFNVLPEEVRWRVLCTVEEKQNRIAAQPDFGQFVDCRNHHQLCTTGRLHNVGRTLLVLTSMHLNRKPSSISACMRLLCPSSFSGKPRSATTTESMGNIIASLHVNMYKAVYFPGLWIWRCQ